MHGLLTIDTWLPLAAGGSYTISWRRSPIVTFRTLDVRDAAPPQGGALIGAAWRGRGRKGPSSSITLIHTPVSDDSRLYPMIESWTETAPTQVTTDVAFEGSTWRSKGANIPDIRDDEEYVARIRRVLRKMPEADAARAAVAYQRTDVAVCGRRRHSRFTVASQKIEDTLLIRTRWTDAAGNTTPWSGTVRVPAGATEGEALVDTAGAD